MEWLRKLLRPSGDDAPEREEAPTPPPTEPPETAPAPAATPGWRYRVVVSLLTGGTRSTPDWESPRAISVEDVIEPFPGLWASVTEVVREAQPGVRGEVRSRQLMGPPPA